MHRESVSPGVYRDDRGLFWARLWFNRRRTWRRLASVKLRAAVQEAAALRPGRALRLAELARLYLDANCPNRRLEERPTPFCNVQADHLAQLLAYFGDWPYTEINLASLPMYAAWRRRRFKRGPGKRTTDLEMVTLSNVLSYAAAVGLIPANPIRSGRPRYCRPENVRHSRRVAPDNADVIHDLARELLEEVKSESLGWQMLFAMFSGCRTSELLRLRTDARIEDDPGFYLDGCLFLGRRSKGGVNPWAMVGTEFEQMRLAWRNWHLKRHPTSPWYFPGRDPRQPVHKTALGHALRRLCKVFGYPHITPHGLRSYYVTKRRSDGANDTQIAGEIGDATVTLMQTTYGARPANWVGGKQLHWLPEKGTPAWIPWSTVDSKLDSTEKPGVAKPS